MIQNRRAYQLIHCRTHSRLLAGAAAVCGAVCGYADLGLYHPAAPERDTAAGQHTGRPRRAGSPVPEARSRRDLPAAAAAGPGGDPFGHRAGI